ncbi:MAG: hypothetical protein EVA67_09590 [OM182 bacterium]|nr:MAG: hypothetical protein EVA67_09590 [OM182 bacterium]HBK18742.1 hypothetical protein [Gammaproteobacteria bacterium]|tara:strand:+ start:1054 stop:1845 length:792 start_codon:yes stop_codon:yes gene_type:complete
MSQAPEITIETREDIALAAEMYDEFGYVLLKKIVPDAALREMTEQLTCAQTALIEGNLESRYGTELLDEPGATVDGKAHRHYVINCTDLSPAAHAAAKHEALHDIAKVVLDSADPWLNDYARFGVVFQDARADAGSKYSRIGWHADYNSDEDGGAWPSFAFTIHIDGTSPANGFLRVVPGSHKLEIDKDEIGSWAFNTVKGEVPVFAEQGDIILHDYKLWHAAARGTADGVHGRRRHVRGAWFGGDRLSSDHGIGTFYKNAAR